MTTARRPAEGTIPAQVLTIFALVVVVTMLHALGRGPLAPPSFDPGAIGAWANAREPAEVGLALMRIGALLVAWHLLAVLVITLVARLIHRPGAVTFVIDRCTVPPLRRLVRHLAGFTVVASTLVTSPVAAGTQPGGGSTAVMVVVPGPENERTEPPSAQAAPGLADRSGTENPASATETHVVRPGDHLWGIARTHLGDRLGVAPTGSELEAHWRRVIEANPQVRNPDLIFVGEVILLPSPEGAARSTVASPPPAAPAPERTDPGAGSEPDTGSTEPGRATMRVERS